MMSNEHAYVMSIEKLLDIGIPIRDIETGLSPPGRRAAGHQTNANRGAALEKMTP